MSVVDSCNNHEKPGFALEVFGEPSAAHRRDMQDPATKNSSRPLTDAARAALWTGILGAAKHIGGKALLPARQRPAVVQLQQGSDATPIYFVGAGLYELHVAQLMPPQHSIYAVEIAWPAAWHDAAARNDINGTPVLEDMVEPYVTGLLAHAGATSCVLMGYSFHASMAFEIAHQLLAKGGRVALLMLLDAPAEYPKPRKVVWNNLREVWRQPQQSIASRLAMSFAIGCWALGVATRFVYRRFAESVLNDSGELTTKLDTLGRPMHWPLIERLYDNSLRSYKLRCLDCRGVLFRADRSEDCPSANATIDLGWADLFGQGLEIVQVTGDHFTMMRDPPHDQALAHKMSQVLDRYCAKPDHARDVERLALRSVPNLMPAGGAVGAERPSPPAQAYGQAQT
jgi:thioesterase domain-containing protein